MLYADKGFCSLRREYNSSHTELQTKTVLTMRSKNKLVMAFLIAFAAIQAKADGNNEVWHIETDTKLSIPLQDIGFIVAADDDVSFSIVTVTNEKLAHPINSGERKYYA